MVIQDPVYNSVLNLHLGRGMISLVRMVSLVRMHVKVHLGVNVSSSAHDCGCVVNGSGTMAAI